MKPITDQAYKLFHDGTLAFSQVEANGIRIDTDYLDRSIIKTNEQIKRLSAKIREDKIYKIWRKHYGKKTNIGSNEQLGKIVFDVLKYPCKGRTKTDKPKTDIIAFADIDLHIVKLFAKLEKIKKANGTYLKGIKKHVIGGFLYPSNNLNTARSMRSSNSDPNFQNIPVRDPKIKKLIRRMFISRPNYKFTEVDFSGIEVACAACYHKDPVMLDYLVTNPGQMHTDMAMQIYMVSAKQLDKKGDIRYNAKNKFVFPQFYGDWYLSCAEALWNAIYTMDLKTAKGTPLKKHLKKKGIRKLGSTNPKDEVRKGTFIYHLKEVEYDFWNNRFSVYEQWKEDWYEEYLRKGYFDTLTGFRIAGVMDKKQVINYPVQGSAFHWLLWVLIKVVKLLKKYKMRTLITGQIHDSIVADVYKREFRNYLEIVQEVVSVELKKHWPWINVPLRIEAEASPTNGNWYQKKEVKI